MLKNFFPEKKERPFTGFAGFGGGVGSGIAGGGGDVTTFTIVNGPPTQQGTSIDLSTTVNNAFVFCPGAFYQVKFDGAARIEWQITAVGGQGGVGSPNPSGLPTPISCGAPGCGVPASCTSYVCIAEPHGVPLCQAVYLWATPGCGGQGGGSGGGYSPKTFGCPGTAGLAYIGLFNPDAPGCTYVCDGFVCTPGSSPTTCTGIGESACPGLNAVTIPCQPGYSIILCGDARGYGKGGIPGPFMSAGANPGPGGGGGGGAGSGGAVLTDHIAYTTACYDICVAAGVTLCPTVVSGVGVKWLDA